MFVSYTDQDPVVLTRVENDFVLKRFFNPMTGQFVVPIMTINTVEITNDPLGRDPSYRKKVIENIHTRLVDKWLYNDIVFTNLLKYFVVDKDKVMLVDNLDKLNDKKLTTDEQKHIFRYIETNIIDKKLVKMILKEYLDKTNGRWSDILSNIDKIKKLTVRKIARILKKLILETKYGQRK
jgi:hypothetical protein